MADKLSEVFGQLTQQFEREQHELREQQGALSRAQQELQAEKAAMMQAGISDADVLELNVGGSILSTKRSTLLQAPEDSVLHAMFSGRWDHSIARDQQGRMFLDFTPKLFEKILCYLRTCRLVPPDQGMKLPVVEEEHWQEFSLMLEYLGLKEMIYGGKRTSAPLVMRACDANITVSQEGTMLTHNTSAAYTHACSVGLDPLREGESSWKVTVRYLTNNHWVGIGLIANPHPANVSYNDSTAYLWAGRGQVHAGGTQMNGLDGWTGWQQGDVAIFQFSSTTRNLKMYHTRLQRVLSISNVPDVSQELRLHVNLHGSNDCVEIAEATYEEACAIV